MKPISLLLLVALRGFGLPVLAQTFTDGDFDEADWEAYKIRYLSNELVETNATGTFSVQQVSTGGSPGSFREITIHYVNDDVGVANMQKSAVWSPATQGAIYQVAYSFHARSAQRTSVSSIGYSPILLQGGIFYWSDSGFGPASDGWESADFFQASPASTFGRVDGEPGHPDFSTNGVPIQFGYLSVLPYGPAGQSAVSGLDNWSVRLTRVSEPRLNITPNPNAQVILTWSKEHIDYHLEAASSLSAGDWVPVTNGVNDLGDRVFVLTSAFGGLQFYRLSK